MVHFLGRFSTVTLLLGYVEYHTPYSTEVRLKTTLHSEIATPTGGYHSPTTLTGMDTSMEATASPRQSGPNESVTCSCASSEDHVFCIRDQPACISGTGTTVTTIAAPPPTVPKAPTTGAGTGSNFMASAT